MTRTAHKYNAQRTDGYRYPRVYGTRSSASISKSSSSRFQYGLHWGCNDCTLTLS